MGVVVVAVCDAAKDTRFSRISRGGGGGGAESGVKP